MFRLSKLALVVCAGAVTAISTAKAADIPQPIPEVVVRGWYLRGDIGYSNQLVDSLYNVLYPTYDTVTNVSKDFDGAPILDFGIGYTWNQWLRFDVTGEYRSKAHFEGHDIGIVGAATIPDDYTGEKSEWLALFNAYLDVGTWHGITPYVGAGVGAANIKISGFTDVSLPVASVAYGGDNDEWNLAWALYAGLGFDVTDALTMDLSYRFLFLGDAESGDLVTYLGGNTVDNPMEFRDITSHDVRLGFRYAFW